MIDDTQRNSLEKIIKTMREADIPRSKRPRTDRIIGDFLKERTRMLYKLDMMVLKKGSFDPKVLTEIKQALEKYQQVIMRTEKPRFKFIKYRGLKKLLSDSVAGIEQLINYKPKPPANVVSRVGTPVRLVRPSSVSSVVAVPSTANLFDSLRSSKTEQQKKDFLTQSLNTQQIDVTFITQNFHQIVGCFKNNKEFFKFLKEVSQGFSQPAQQSINTAIVSFELPQIKIANDAKAMNRGKISLPKFLRTLGETVQGQQDTYADVMLSDNRTFFSIMNWLNIGEGSGVHVIEHPALRGKLSGIFKDRHDWANFLGACSNQAEVDEMLKMIPALFKNNPELARRFDQDSIFGLVEEAKRTISDPRYKEYFDKNPQQYVTYFYREIYLRLYETPKTSSLVIEQGLKIENLRQLVTSAEAIKDPVPDYIRYEPESSVSSLKDKQDKHFSGADYYEQVYHAAYSYVDLSKDLFRNENVGFLSSTSWMLKNMSLPTLMDRPEQGTPVDHLLANISGLQTEKGLDKETEIYQPFTTGNCWDQASIQLLHLAIKGPQLSDPSKDPKRYAYHVGNSQADHSYVIITALSWEELKLKGCLNSDGTIKMLNLFETDKQALISDPWAKAIYSYPQLGLHYAVQAHNDDTVPPAKPEDQDKVSITSYCTIGEPLSIKLGYRDPEGQTRLDGQVQALVDAKGSGSAEARWLNLCAGVTDRQFDKTTDLAKSLTAVLNNRKSIKEDNQASYDSTMAAWEARREGFRNEGRSFRG